jgi:hypothetical protein
MSGTGDGYRSKVIFVTVMVAIVLFATVTAMMGWLPLKPKNDLLRTLQMGEGSGL